MKTLLILLSITVIVIGGYFVLVNMPSTDHDEVDEWNVYTYPSVESGILPDITFKYPPVFGSEPTFISSRNTNPPDSFSENWVGIVDFIPTGAFGEDALRMEYVTVANPELSLENYVGKATSADESIKYFQTGNYRVARSRHTSSSHYDADVGWYFIELSDGITILTISTSGDKKYLYDDDINGYSTRDKIISTLVIGQP